MAEENVVDRGDEIAEEVASAQPETPEVKDEVAAEEAVDEALGKTDAAEEKPRDETGKFTKKEREVPDHVPKSRFDDAVGKERAAREAAEARAAELEARVRQEEKSVDIQKMEDAVEALEKQHSKFLLDGEHEKAAATMKEIRHAERAIARIESDEKAGQATAQAVEQVRMEAAIASLEASHPQFNPESEEFDQDLVDLVLAEQGRLMRTERMAPSKALTTAGAKIMKKFAPQAETTEAKGLAAAKGADRKAEQVAKNLDTAKRQPPSMKDAGKDSDKAGAKIDGDVSSMSIEEWDALPESTKAKLRGDNF